MFRVMSFCSLLLAVTLFVSPACAENDASPEADKEAKTAHDEAAHDEKSDSHDDHDAHSTDHAEATPNPLEFDPDLAIWTLIVFLAMLVILKTFAWGPIMKALADREDSISGAIDAATAKHEEAKALLAEHQTKLAGAADEVRELLEEARRDAEHTKADILAEAKAAADTERERAVRDIEQARDVVVRELAEQTAGLAIDLAAKVVNQDITPSRQGEIVNEALNRFSGPSQN